MSKETEQILNGNSEKANESDHGEKRVGCAHYQRRVKFVTPCCNKLYMCRYCHDEKEKHHFNRKTVTELVCTECDTRQKVQADCMNCGVRFGKYTCLICNLFDDEDKRQYHCDGCGICRVGGRDRFFHCERCNMCLPVQLQRVGHRCVENVSRSNCPVCLEDIHTSRIPCHIPDCGHLLHRPCFEQLLQSGHYACPTCQTSMIDMTNLWSYLDSEVAATPMPAEYADYQATILCKDCHKLSTVKFHVVGLKCQHCGAYNTCQTNGFHKEASQSPSSSSSADAESSTSTSTSTSRSGSSSAAFPEREAGQSAGNGAGQAAGAGAGQAAGAGAGQAAEAGTGARQAAGTGAGQAAGTGAGQTAGTGAGQAAGAGEAEGAGELLPRASPLDEPPQA